MASDATEALLADIEEQLEAHGVQNYIVALSDPDSPVDAIRYFGSAYWRIGAAVDVIDDTKQQIILERK